MPDQNLADKVNEVLGTDDYILFNDRDTALLGAWYDLARHSAFAEYTTTAETILNLLALLGETEVPQVFKDTLAELRAKYGTQKE